MLKGTQKKKRKNKRKGKKIIKIKYVRDKDKRKVTFSKRKKTCLRLVEELNKLTRCPYVAIIQNDKGKIWASSSNGLQNLKDETVERIEDDRRRLKLSQSVSKREKENKQPHNNTNGIGINRNLISYINSDQVISTNLEQYDTHDLDQLFGLPRIDDFIPPENTSQQQHQNPHHQQQVVQQQQQQMAQQQPRYSQQQQHQIPPSSGLTPFPDDIEPFSFDVDLTTPTEIKNDFFGNMMNDESSNNNNGNNNQIGFENPIIGVDDYDELGIKFGALMD